jgi:hypothetical protein
MIVRRGFEGVGEGKLDGFQFSKLVGAHCTY